MIAAEAAAALLRLTRPVWPASALEGPPGRLTPNQEIRLENVLLVLLHPASTRKPAALVAQRMQARHDELHRERLASITPTVDMSPPEHMHHLEHNAKKQMQMQERKQQIQEVWWMDGERLMIITGGTLLESTSWRFCPSVCFAWT